MQSFITTTQLPGLVAIAARGTKVTDAEMAVAQFFSHGDAMRLLMPQLSYLDCLSLSRALAKLAPQIRVKIPSFRTVVNSQLAAIGVKFDLTGVVQASSGVITGSFLLHCLLQPLSTLGYSRIFPPGSDIDLLSDADDKIKCPHCLRRLLTMCKAPMEIMKSGGGSQFNWLVGYGRQTLNFDRSMKPGYVLKKLMAHVKATALIDANGRYHGDVKGYDFPHLADKCKSKLSVALCPHLTFFESQRAYQGLPVVGRSIWIDADGFKFDDVRINANKGIHRWMYESVDFGFCHNSFDGTKLRIHKPHQLLRRHCQYQLDSKLISIIESNTMPMPGVTVSFDGDQVLIKTDIKTFKSAGYIPLLFSSPSHDQVMQCYHLLKTYVIRGQKYIDRGFKIDFSHVLAARTIARFVDAHPCAGDLRDQITRLMFLCLA